MTEAACGAEGCEEAASPGNGKQCVAAAAHGATPMRLATQADARSPVSKKEKARKLSPT